MEEQKQIHISLLRDNKDPYNYYRTTKDNRIIAGGEDVNFIPDINNEDNGKEKYAILEQRLKKMFPFIENIEAQYKYCGFWGRIQKNHSFGIVQGMGLMEFYLLFQVE